MKKRREESSVPKKERKLVRTGSSASVVNNKSGTPRRLAHIPISLVNARTTWACSRLITRSLSDTIGITSPEVGKRGHPKREKVLFHAPTISRRFRGIAFIRVWLQRLHSQANTAPITSWLCSAIHQLLQSVSGRPNVKEVRFDSSQCLPRNLFWCCSCRILTSSQASPEFA